VFFFLIFSSSFRIKNETNNNGESIDCHHHFAVYCSLFDELRKRKRRILLQLIQSHLYTNPRKNKCFVVVHKSSSNGSILMSKVSQSWNNQHRCQSPKNE